MKTLLSTLIVAVALAAADKPAEVKKSTPLTDAQAREVREAQLAVAQAIINQTEAEKQTRKIAEDAQSKLSDLVNKLTKTNCPDCLLGQDLKWIEPAKPEAKKTEDKK